MQHSLLFYLLSIYFRPSLQSRSFSGRLTCADISVNPPPTPSIGDKIMLFYVLCSLTKNQNAPRPSEHPPVRGKICQNVQVGSKAANTKPLHSIQTGSPREITLGQQYNVGEKPIVILYTYINRHAGTPEKQ